MKSMWIKMPDLDVYTQFFKDFFGQSEMVLFFIVPLIIFYFIKLFSEKQKQKNTINPIEDKFVFSFILLFLWILITIIIPLIRTYTSLPMLVNRYFINILPAVLITVSIGLSAINNKTVKYGMVSILVVFSLSDIFIVKNYYTQPNKSQFREVSDFVKRNAVSTEPVYTSLAWYFNYFITDQKLEDKSMNEVVDERIKDTTKAQPFWYINANGNKFEISKEQEQFLTDTYVIDKSFEGCDAWAKRFVPKKMFKQNINILKYKPFSKKQYGKKIHCWIENFEENKDSLKVSGWTFLKNINSENSTIYVVLFHQTKAFHFLTKKITRPDITAVENDGFDYHHSGFESNIPTKGVESGKYTLGIVIKNKEDEGFFISERQIIIQ